MPLAFHPSRFFLSHPVPHLLALGKVSALSLGPPLYKIEFSLNTTVSLSLLCCESAKSSLLPVAANVTASLTAAPAFPVYAQLASFLPMHPRTLGLLWVCSMPQPCFLRDSSMSCPPAPSVPLPYLSKSSLSSWIQIPPPCHFFPASPLSPVPPAPTLVPNFFLLGTNSCIGHHSLSYMALWFFLTLVLPSQFC